MKKLIAGLLSAALAATIAFGLSACVPQEPSELREDATVTVFTTNDIHGNVENNAQTGVIGIKRAAELKASVQNSVLVDVGDATQGASFASVSRGADVIAAMNAADYDLMTAGNHEFDYGAEVLAKNAELADFPILAANVKKDGKALLDSSVILERADYKIGFIGLTTVSTASSTNPTLLDGITFEDEVTEAKEQIAQLKDQTDAIVLICHMGDNASAVSCTSEKLIKSLDADEWSNVAAVIDGHSHTVENKAVDGIPVVQTGVNSANLGKITISFKDGVKGANFKAHGEVLDYEEAMNCEISEEGAAKGTEVENVIGEIKEAQSKILDEKLCTLSSPLWGGYICYNYVESRIVETAYGDFVTDAFRYYAKQFAENEGLNMPVIAVENGGGISQSLPTWHYNSDNVTRGDVLNAFNHGNLVEVLKVSPSELFSVIEKGLAVTGQDENGHLLCERVSGSFIQCSGFSYTYNPSGETGSKLAEVKLDDGTVLDRNDTEKKLLLSTNNYVSASFANGEKLGELGGEDILVEDYILFVSGENNGVLDYDCDYNRILIADDKSPETYTVKIQVKGTDENAKAGTYRLSVDGGQAEEKITDSEGYLTVTLTKGAHTLKLAESSNFVYVNNYSGTGTVSTMDGYYTFSFILSENAS